MSANETVYEFGSSPEEDGDNNPHPRQQQQQLHSPPNKNTMKQQQPQQTNIAGTNLRSNKTSSTSINQKLNTSFRTDSDTHQSNQPNSSNQANRFKITGEISASDELLVLKTEQLSVSAAQSGEANNDNSSTAGPGSISNTSNTSLSSVANSNTSSTRGQSGNLSLSVSTKGHQGSSASSSHQHQNPNFDSHVISERVKNLATQIYQELKRIISRCNYDEDILSGLMPLIVRVLESLDLALIENQQLQVELELCKDDNDQLIIMLEKEKAAKRATDKKLIESEYAYEEERQQYQQKIESLDSVVKMYELKTKNASDQAARFEEKEAERKKEYSKLHDRYTELLKSHCDVVERVRHLFGNQAAANLSSINVPHQMGLSSTDLTMSDPPQQLTKTKLHKSDDTDLERAAATRSQRDHTLKSWNAETELALEDASLVVIEDMLGGPHNKMSDVSSQIIESDRTISESGAADGELGKEGENDSIAYTSMEREFRKLIQENKDLLDTKNALNVVKDDLIAEVDRLTNEVTMYEQAVEQLNTTKDQMKLKVSALDSELRKTKEELEKAKLKIRENNEEGVPYSQRKRFGRAEMAKVLMERNNYKEKYMELQDAIRYTEHVRANKVETEKRSGLWKFFSNLFGAPLAIGPAGSQTSMGQISPAGSYHTSLAATFTSTDSGQLVSSGGTHQFVGSDGLIGGSTNPRLTSNSDLIVLMDSDLNIDRSRAIFKDSGSSGLGGGKLISDSPGYIHAYGWSLPASSVKSLSSSFADSPSRQILGSTSSNHSSSLDSPLIGVCADGGVSFNKLTSLHVPVPQYCRPLTGDSLGMKIWCATAINFRGGDSISPNRGENSLVSGSSRDPDLSGSIVNISSSSLNRQQSSDQSSDDRTTSPNIPRITATTSTAFEASKDLSSCVWICSTQYSKSKITIIDIKTKPNELLDSFHVPTFLYCIKSIPGCFSSDLEGIDSSEVTEKEDGEENLTMKIIEYLVGYQKKKFYRLVRVSTEEGQRSRRVHQELNRTAHRRDSNLSPAKEADESRNLEEDPEISRVLDNNVSVGIATLQKLSDFVAHTQPSSPQQSEKPEIPTALDRSSLSELDKSQQQDVVYHQSISTCLPTVWMGGKDAVLYVHSAIGQWKDCVACIKLKDSILQMCHYRGRVFVALADGSLCVFFRDMVTKEWEFSRYLLIDINLMADIANESVLAESLPRKDFSKPTNVSTTSDSNILSDQIGGLMYTDHSPIKNESSGAASSASQQSGGPRMGSKVAGIRCLEIANQKLWVGYRNRVLVIDPLELVLLHAFNVVPQVDNQVRQIISMNDGIFCCLRSDLILRLYSSLKPYQHIQNIDIEPVVTRLISPKTFVISHITAMKVANNTLWIGNAHGIILTIPCKLVPQISETSLDSRLVRESDSLAVARYVPKCDIFNAQISFHGHKDAVKFFVHAHDLMLSGGQGYLDFRLDMDDQSKSINDKGHLILWQLPQ